MFDIKSKHFEYEVIHTLKDGWKRTLKISLISQVFSAIQHNMGTAAISIWSSSLGMRSLSQSRAQANFLWPRMSLWKENKEFLLIKWSFFRETSMDGSGKNKKSWFFLLGLKYTLRTCFESKKFLSKSCPELSNQVLSFSEGQIYLIVWVRLPDNFFSFLTSGGQVWI